MTTIAASPGIRHLASAKAVSAAAEDPRPQNSDADPDALNQKNDAAKMDGNGNQDNNTGGGSLQKCPPGHGPFSGTSPNGVMDTSALESTPSPARRTSRRVSAKKTLHLEEEERGVLATATANFYADDDEDVDDSDGDTVDDSHDAGAGTRRSSPRASARPSRFRQPEATEEALPSDRDEEEEGEEEEKEDRGAKAKSKAGKASAPFNTRKVKKSRGTWSVEEKEQFRRGIVLCGWGNWSAIEETGVIPTRDKIQIKSHGQKFEKHNPGVKGDLLKKYQEHLGKKLKDPKKNEREGKAAPDAKPEAKKKEAKQKLATVSHNAAATSKPKPSAKVSPNSPRKSKEAALPMKRGRGRPRGVKNKPKTASSQSRPLLPLAKYRKEPVGEPPKKKRMTVVDDTNDAPRGGSRGSWSYKEKEQFKDAIILFGWGNWRGMAKVVPTRTKDQIKSHAQKWAKHHEEEKKKLLAEHSWRAELIRNKDTVIDMTGAMEKSASRDPPLARAMSSDSETSADDFGAAEAILALTGASRSGSPLTFGAKDAQPPAKKDENIDVEPSTENAGVLNEDTPMKSEETSDPDCNNMAVESDADVKRKDAAPKESLEVSDSCEALDETSKTATKYTQPPPNWLAADSWDECLGKIHLWNHELSESEQNKEYMEYHHLSNKEKDRLREKLVNLMNQQPPMPSV